MKTKSKNQNQKSGLSNRPGQLSTKNRPKIDMALRRANRRLETEKLLALLRNETPRYLEVTEVVGKWVWIQFSDKQSSDITRELAKLGFHCNNRRQSYLNCGLLGPTRLTNLLELSLEVVEKIMVELGPACRLR